MAGPTNIRQYGTRAIPKLLEKVNIIDIVDNLTSGGTGVPLSAQQGKILKTLLGTESAARVQAVLDLKGTATASADTLGKLENLIANEATARASGDLASADALAAQATTLRSEFQAADVTLQSNLNNVQSQMQTALASETARAQAAELTLTDDLNQEISDRQTALTNEATARTNAILAEKTRAMAAEATIVSSVTSERVRAEAAEFNLQTAINAEQSRAEGAESVLQNNIDTERTQRQTIDTALDSRLAAIESGLVAGILWKAVLPDMSALDALDELSQEGGWGFYVGVEKDVYVVIDSVDGDYQPPTWNTKSFLKFADFAEVTGMVNAEKTRALAAESTLAADISAERTRAMSAESTLTTNLTNEIARAKAAEQLVQSNLVTEIARATADVNAEQSRATGEESRIEGLVAQEVTDRQNAIVTERTRAQTEEARIAGLISNEVTARIADVDAEQVRATNAEQVLTNGLNNEISNRQTAVTNEATTRADADNALSARTDVLEGAEEVVGSVEWAYGQARLYTSENVLRPKVEGAGGTLLVVGDTITVSNAIADGINGIVYGEVIVFAGDNDSEALSVNIASVSGSQLTLAVTTLNEFAGKKAKVSYFYRESEQVGGGQGGAGTGKAGV
jgi:hypothetical protein